MTTPFQSSGGQSPFFNDSIPLVNNPVVPSSTTSTTSTNQSSHFNLPELVIGGGVGTATAGTSNWFGSNTSSIPSFTTTTSNLAIPYFQSTNYDWTPSSSTPNSAGSNSTPAVAGGGGRFTSQDHRPSSTGSPPYSQKQPNHHHHHHQPVLLPNSSLVTLSYRSGSGSQYDTDSTPGGGEIINQEDRSTSPDRPTFVAFPLPSTSSLPSVPTPAIAPVLSLSPLATNRLPPALFLNHHQSVPKPLSLHNNKTDLNSRYNLPSLNLLATTNPNLPGGGPGGPGGTHSGSPSFQSSYNNNHHASETLPADWNANANRIGAHSEGGSNDTSQSQSDWLNNNNNGGGGGEEREDWHRGNGGGGGDSSQAWPGTIWDLNRRNPNGGGDSSGSGSNHHRDNNSRGGGGGNNNEGWMNDGHRSNSGGSHRNNNNNNNNDNRDGGGGRDYNNNSNNRSSPYNDRDYNRGNNNHNNNNSNDQDYHRYSNNNNNNNNDNRNDDRNNDNRNYNRNDNNDRGDYRNNNNNNNNNNDRDYSRSSSAYSHNNDNRNDRNGGGSGDRNDRRGGGGGGGGGRDNRDRDRYDYDSESDYYNNNGNGSSDKRQRKQRRRNGEPPRDLANRRYTCTECVTEPKSFARPSALKIHMLTHTKEKPHICPVCDRPFAISSNLKRHRKLHDQPGNNHNNASVNAHLFAQGANNEGTSISLVAPLVPVPVMGGAPEASSEVEAVGSST